MDAVAEVKSRLNIEDVVSEYVQLKRAGRNFKGLSPWTNEKTASFMVSPEKQIWHDFSSGKGGDIFTFVMEMEGLDFRGALEHLARKAGVELEDYQTSDSHRKLFKNRALEALQLATKFYQKQLIANKAALEYLLKDRGFSKQTLLDWQLGYAPKTGRALTDFLTKKGFDTDEMKRAGLIFMRTGGPSDMFRGRIMIPLCDSRGTEIGFTARLLNEEPDAPKYINTPQTVVYDKGRHVFGLHLAKESIRKKGYGVIVEGNMDVIASHQAGVKNTVATAGTAMTENHLRELKRFTPDIRLCFDADTAGVSATERAIALAQKTGVDLGVLTLDGAKDPDELIQSDAAKWQQAVQNSQYAVDWLIGRYSTELDLGSAQGKKAFTDALLAVIRRLSDPVEQDHYLNKLAEMTGTSIEAMRSKFAGQKSQARALKKPKVSQQADRAQAEQRRIEDHLLSIALMQPKLRHMIDDCQDEYFVSGTSIKLLGFIKSNPDFKGEPQLSKELQQISDYVKILVLQFEELYQELPLEELREQVRSLKRRLIAGYVKIQKRRLAEEMSTTNDEKKLQRMISQVDKLNKLIVGT
ncbi:MAG TPA: DNA primase, partial [Candidatus Saccharimonadales bacterium]|nr:DNA primase [Candidatus Saccharimonadales bacterium]